jgi:hypothetical protein
MYSEHHQSGEDARATGAGALGVQKGIHRCGTTDTRGVGSDIETFVCPNRASARRIGDESKTALCPSTTHTHRAD